MISLSERKARAGKIELKYFEDYLTYNQAWEVMLYFRQTRMAF